MKASGSRQRGSALVVILGVLGLFAAYVAIGKLDPATIHVTRDRQTNRVLAIAKDALVNYAASDVNRPGELPCPDVNNDGKLVIGEDLIGSACASLIGRVPWATLGLPDLRDDAGERLWYALSNDFHAGGSTALNNDTAFRPGNTSLSIAGNQPSANVVAIVFSAGSALTRSDNVVQTRGCTGGTCDANGKCITSPATLADACNPRNYLDWSLTVDNADGDSSYVAAAVSANFNDRLLPVLSDDIMSIVQRRAGRELSQKLRSHFDAWQNATAVSAASRKGFYPFAAPLTTVADPSLSQAGTDGTTDGLLPLSNANVVWDSASIGLGTCTGVNTTQISCTALVVLGIGGNVTGSVRGIGTAIIDPPDGTEMTTGGLVLLGTPSASPWTISGRKLDFSAGISFLGTGIVTVSVRAPNVTSAWVNDASYWVTANKWKQNTYYVVSSPYAIDGSGTCGTCAQIEGAGKRAVLLMTGRALQGQRARPPANTSGFAIADFLEGSNQSPAALVLARGIPTPTFNDAPIEVLP